MVSIRNMFGELRDRWMFSASRNCLTTRRHKAEHCHAVEVAHLEDYNLRIDIQEIFANNKCSITVK